MHENSTVFASGWNKIVNAPKPFRLTPISLERRTRADYNSLRGELLSGGASQLDYETWKTINEGEPLQLKLF